MKWLVVSAVGAFCPWDASEVEELGIDSWLLPIDDRVRDWKLVAETSVRRRALTPVRTRGASVVTCRACA